jgi:hypothetical protein
MMNNCTLKPYAPGDSTAVQPREADTTAFDALACGIWRASRPIEYLAGYRTVARARHSERVSTPAPAATACDRENRFTADM